MDVNSSGIFSGGSNGKITGFPSGGFIQRNLK
jgi:hypothetical protein